MTTVPKPRAGDAAMRCERCGADFACARDAPGGCWCAAAPFRLPVPLPAAAGAFGDCLCPACLRAVADMLAGAKTSSA